MSKAREKSTLTSGAIYAPMMKFMLPVIAATFLQAMYAAVDLLVIGRFVSTDATVIQNATAAVGTGGMIMTLITYVIQGLTTGITVTLGRFIGAKDRKGATRTVGSAICIFAVMAVCLTLIMEIGAPYFAKWMNAPDVEMCTLYLRICGGGLIFITAYNGISGLFKGIGNSNLPLVFVGIACVVNIALDLILVIAAGLGVAGVAIATITAQAVSVVLSLIIISRKQLPFDVSKKSIRFHPGETKSILLAGVPLATQDFLTNFSFVVINSVANHLGSDATVWSAIASGYSVDNKLTAFMMAIPVAFLQSMSVFTAQNVGAKQPERIKKGLRYMIFTSIGAGILLSLLCYFGGSAMASIFTSDAQSIYYAAEYLKGYAADALVACLLLMMTGYFNGQGHSTFSMTQGLIGAFCVRIPIILAISKMADATLFQVGFFGAMATYTQLIICICFFFVFKKKDSRKMQASTPASETTALQPSVPGPIITISREHGSCGKQIGGILAERLGVPFYYKEVAAMAAEECGLHREFISDINVNTPSVMKELYLSNSVIQDAVRAQDSIVRKIADQGSCVIVGRAADYILRDYPNVIRIFIYAPEEYKIAQIMQEYGDSETEARKNVQQRTASRSSYYRSITGKEWGDMHNYNFVIDSSVGVEKSVDMIMNMMAVK
ncbi:MAG: cytidylate kinase family protein [Clostridiales bacterium]|nr:cytidylate kinase family protein [Clostridiales bacterium]